MKKQYLRYKILTDSKPLTCPFGKWMKIKFITKKIFKYIICRLALPACQMMDVTLVYNFLIIFKV